MLWISKCLQSNPKTRIMQPNTGICELDKGNLTKEGLIHHKDLKLKYMYCLWQFLSKYIYKTLRHCSKGNCTHRRTSSTVKDHPTGPTLSSTLLKSPTIKQFSSLIFTGWEIPFRCIHTLLYPLTVSSPQIEGKDWRFCYHLWLPCLASVLDASLLSYMTVLV